MNIFLATELINEQFYKLIEVVLIEVSDAYLSAYKILPLLVF